jgi:hypothetical protein
VPTTGPGPAAAAHDAAWPNPTERAEHGLSCRRRGTGVICREGPPSAGPVAAGRIPRGWGVGTADACPDRDPRSPRSCVRVLHAGGARPRAADGARGDRGRQAHAGDVRVGCPAAPTSDASRRPCATARPSSREARARSQPAVLHTPRSTVRSGGLRQLLVASAQEITLPTYSGCLRLGLTAGLRLPADRVPTSFEPPVDARVVLGGDACLPSNPSGGPGRLTRPSGGWSTSMTRPWDRV